MFQKNKNQVNAQKILVIDEGVLDSEILLADLQPDFKVVRLSSNLDPITQISQALFEHSLVSEVAIVAHGQPGQINFSNYPIDQTLLVTRESELANWVLWLTVDAKICIYSCSLASGEIGQEFIYTLKDLTGAEVASSSLPIGKVGADQNWSLDRLTSPFDVLMPFNESSMVAYQHTLAPEISISGASTVENGFLDFVVTLSETSLSEIRIPYRTLENSGTALGEDFDFREVAGTLVIPAGGTSGTINVRSFDRGIDEADESVVLELFDPLNGVFANGAGNLRATGVILDTDGTGNNRALFVSQVQIVEGNDGSQQAVFDVQLSQASSNAITLDYTTSDGSALAGQDYQAQTDSVTFSPGETLKSVAVPIIGDTIAEANEFFNLVFTPNPAIANGVDGAVGTAMILDDDTSTSVPEISISGASTVENGTLQFVVTLSETSLSEIRIPYRTLENSGTALGEDFDFREVAGTLVIPAGGTSGTINVRSFDRGIDEADESVVLELFTPENGVFPDGVDTLQATGIILDNDGTGNNLGLFVGNAQIVEGENNYTREVAVPIQLSRPSDQTLTFQYQTADGSAQAGDDYTSQQSGTVTFSPGQTLAAAFIPIVGDSVEEEDETFTLTVTPTAAIANGSDGAIGTITIIDGDVIDPTPTNRDPVASDDGGSGTTGFATDEDTAFTTASVLTNDSDVDVGDTLSVSGLDTTGTAGLVTDNGDGTFDYDPNGAFEALGANDSATDSFAYMVSDGNGGSDTATVTVTVQGVNDNPDAIDDTASTGKNSPVVINVLSGDTDSENDTLTVTSVGLAANGVAGINPDNTVTYTPNDGFMGTDNFTYTISDGNGGSDTANVEVTVTQGPNTAPVASAIVAGFGEDEVGRAVDLLSTASDADGDDLDVENVVVTAADGRVLTTTTNTETGLLTLGDGQFEDLAAGVPFDITVDYDVTDGQESVGNTATITITGENDTPIAGDDGGPGTTGFATDEDTAFTTASVLTNDSDVDVGDTLSVSGLDMTGAAGLVTDNGDGTFDYDPNGAFEALGANDTATDSFDYTVTDGNGGNDTATVTVTIQGINDNPDAIDDTASTNENSPVVIDVLSNDTDVENDTLTVSSVVQAANGTVGINADNTVTYTPDSGFTGTDNFTYTISDGNGGSNTANVEVMTTVVGSNTIVGTTGNDNLIGTNLDENLFGNGGAFDFFTGGGGADIFTFTTGSGNGREVGTITDYMPGEDMIDFDGGTILTSFGTGSTTYLFLDGGEFDTLIVNGVGAVTDIDFV